MTEQSQMWNSSVNPRDIKFSKKNPEFLKQNGNVIQIYIPVPNQQTNHLDVIEDLDIWQVTTMIPQLLSYYKTTKKNKDSQLITIDLDKKKELVNSVYRHLYYRNQEIERGMNNFQAKLWQDNKISYWPVNKPKKGENYCENYVVSFSKRFPHILRHFPSMPVQSTPTKNWKPLTKKDSNLFVPFSQGNGNPDTTTPSDSSPFDTSPKNIRSASLKVNRARKELEPIPFALKEHDGNVTSDKDVSPEHHEILNQDQTNGSQIKLINGESNKRRGNNGLGFGFRSEHHFRIVKKRVSLFNEGKSAEERNAKSHIARSHKADNQVNQGMFEEIIPKNDIDHQGDKDTTQITSRLDIGNLANKSYVGNSSRPKNVKASNMRSWSTEKPRPNSVLDETGIKPLAHVKYTYKQMSGLSSQDFKDDKIFSDTDMVAVKTAYKSKLVSPMNEEDDEDSSKGNSVEDMKVNHDYMLRELLPELNQNFDETEEKNNKMPSINQKPSSTVSKLHQKHHKHHSDASYIPQAQKS